MLDLIGKLPKTLRECKEVSGDISRVEKWAADIDSKPITIFQNIAKHWDKLNEHLTKLGQDFKDGEFGKAGKDTGLVLLDILGPVPNPAPKKPRFDNPYGGYAQALGVNPYTVFGSPDDKQPW